MVIIIIFIYSFVLQLVMAAAAGNGLQVSSVFSRNSGVLQCDLKFENRSQQMLANFALRLNPGNFAGLDIATKLQVREKPNQ